MKIVVGLGNPGKGYQGTPHNVGFETLDRLGGRLGAEWRGSAREKAEIAEVQAGGEKLLLVRPMTYMNLSGESVREVMRNRPAELGDLLVISDDVALEIGRLRIRAKGSHGGQNGLRSLIACLGSDEFARLRIGIRPNRPIGELVEFVLSRPRPEEARELARMTEVAAEAVEFWLRSGTEAAANKFNGTSPS